MNQTLHGNRLTEKIRHRVFAEKTPRGVSTGAPSRLPYRFGWAYRIGAWRNTAAETIREAAVADALHRHWRGLAALAGVLVLLSALAWGYVRTLRTLYVEVDGRTVTVRSHLDTIGDALTEANIQILPEDRVDPPVSAPLRSGQHVRIQRARTLNITVDGKPMVFRTLADNIGNALTEAGIKWIPEDRITVNGQEVQPMASLATAGQPASEVSRRMRMASSRGGRNTDINASPAPLNIDVQRAVPIGVQDGQVPYTFLTTARTLGEALLQKGIVLYAADVIEPPLDTPIKPGLSATIERSRPVTLYADGKVRQTRTRAKTVSDLLKDEGLSLGALDYTRPSLTQSLSNNMRVTLVRVQESDIVEQEPIAFELQYRGNPDLEIDHQQLDNPGAPGVFKRSLHVRTENGIEVSRTLEKEWVDQPPQNRIVSYGTKIVERPLSTPEGTLTYWRKIRVFVTAYTAATCGKSPGDPTYGITRVGWPVHKGIIAVDPKVIPLYTKMYVPGYGQGVAGDTGGAIKGQHIDLAYDQSNFIDWWKTIDVYLLTPAPPRSQIRWVLPNMQLMK